MIGAELDNENILGTGSGKSKKEAEQKAAADALNKGEYITCILKGLRCRASSHLRIL